MRCLVFAVIAVALGCANLDRGPRPTERVDFDVEVRNLTFVSKAFRTDAPLQSTMCAQVAGEIRYGELVHRLHGEPAKSSRNFVNFAAVYSNQGPPRLLTDLDRNNRFDCNEIDSTVAHPDQSGRFFRTVVLAWNGSDGGGERVRRYRIVIPGQLDASSENRYSLDLVDVPVARWNVGGNSAILALYDGNHDGLHERRFGDALLVDPTGQGRFDMQRGTGTSFFSYNFPIRVPWGSYQVAALDPDGEFIELAPVPDASVDAPYALGDFVPSLVCDGTDGESIAVGGPSETYRLVYFWISHCGSCEEDVTTLAPYLRELDRRLMTPIGISMDELEEDFKSFVRQHGLDWQQCFAERMLWEHPVARSLGIRGPKEFVVIDPQGRLVARGTGADDVRNVVEDLLAQAAARASLE